MIEVAFVVFLHFLFLPTGLVLSAVANGNQRTYVAVSGIIGYGTIGVLSHIFYTWGISVSILAIGFSLLSTGSLIIVIVYHRELISINLRDTLFYLGALGLLISPALIGGGQFVIFQGNSYDHFNYLQSAISYQDHSYEYLINAGVKEFLADPLVVYGSGNLNGRPAVMILYGVVSNFFRGSVVQLPYIYLCFFVAQIILALVWVGRETIGARKNWMPVLVGGAFGLGFWGQYLLDQNWWSQISATAILIVLVYRVVRISAVSEQIGFREGFVLTLLLISSIYFYPEGVIFFVPGLFVVSLFLAWSSPALFIRLLIVGVISIIVASINYSPLLEFVIFQISTVSSGAMPEYLQGFHGYFIFGNDGISRELLEKVFSFPEKEGFIFGTSNSVLAELVDILAGVSGIFFLTPGMGGEPWNTVLIRVLLMLFIVGVFLEIVYSIRYQRGNRTLNFFLIFFVSELAIIGILFERGGYYGVLKGYFYLVAVCFPILCFTVSTKLGKRNLIVIFLSIQILFGVTRLHAAANSTGIHYRFPPYPSANLVSQKASYSWDIEKYNDVLQGCRGLKITDTFDNGFYETFVQLLAKANRIPYFLEGPVRKNYGVSEEIRGYMMAIEYDCLVAQSKEGNPKTLIITRN